MGYLFQNDDENAQKWSKLGKNNQKSHVDLIRRQMDLKIGKITFEYTKPYSTYIFLDNINYISHNLNVLL